MESGQMDQAWSLYSLATSSGGLLRRLNWASHIHVIATSVTGSSRGERRRAEEGGATHL